MDLGTRGTKLFIINPMYPCPFEERLGDWGDGGKVNDLPLRVSTVVALLPSSSASRVSSHPTPLTLLA
ncbi:unnamed protein product, partial [Closterium sp. NIES-64]